MVRRALRGDLLEDDGGAMMLLAGVLLVLGFVTIGAMLVQLEAMEADTARTQRDSTVPDFRIVLQELNNSVGAKVRLGAKDVGSFLDRSNDTKQDISRVATRKGFYVDMVPAGDASSSVYARMGRCPTPVDFDRGVVLGFDRASSVKSIVGAVYDVYLTNGQESLTYRYYVKVFDCLETDTYNYFHRITDLDGSIDDAANAQGPEGPTPADDDTDGDDAMTLEEGTSAPGSAVEEVEPDGVSNQWNDPLNALASDDLYATNSEPNNRLKIAPLDLSGLPPQGTIVGSVLVHIEQQVSSATAQFEVFANYGTNDNCNEGIGYSGGTQLGTVLVDGNLTFEFPTDPELGAWDLSDLDDLEVCIHSVKLFGPNPTWKVDYVHLEVVVEPTPENTAEYEIEWDFIPSEPGQPFVSHSLQLRYANGDEDWLIDVWDADSETWNTRHTITDNTGGSFVTWSYAMTAQEMEGGFPQIRIRDATPTNLLAETIQFDYIRILSTV